MKTDLNEFIIKTFLTCVIITKYNLPIKDVVEEYEGITQQIIAEEEGLV